jgi:hypothetical protein
MALVRVIQPSFSQHRATTDQWGQSAGPIGNPMPLVFPSEETPDESWGRASALPLAFWPAREETIGLSWGRLVVEAPSESSAAGPKPCPTIAIANNEWQADYQSAAGCQPAPQWFQQQRRNFLESEKSLTRGLDRYGPNSRTHPRRSLSPACPPSKPACS